MDIRFTVNETTYQLTTDKYQFILNKVSTTKTGKNIGSENFTVVGFYKTPFIALKSLLDKEIYNSECKGFDELAKRYEQTINSINEIADKFKLK